MADVETTLLGLSDTEARDRLHRLGPNELPHEKSYSKLRLFLNQFNSPLMFILFCTIGISIFLKHYPDTIFIAVVMISNVAVAYWQESKAGDAISKLKKMVTINARVVRSGNEKQVDSKNLVVGDVIILHSGDKVPADVRIVEARSLKISEASLTGESQAVEKHTRKLPLKTGITEQANMAFMGTIVEEGWAKAVVVATGIKTEMGEIVHLLSETEEETTPLQKHMSKLARMAAVFILFLITVFATIAYYRGQSPAEILLASLSLVVSTIPAGLLPAITIILVLAMRRIFKQNGLVRKLVSNETLGSITVICTDKTGTLTEGRMGVTHMVTPMQELSDKQLANFHIDNSDPANEGIKQLAKIAILNNDAYVENPEAPSDKWVIRGKITEQALLKASTLMGFNKKTLEQEHLLIDKIYFTSELKYSASLREVEGDGSSLFVVGAPEIVFAKSKNIPVKLEKRVEELTLQGLRVIAVAHRSIEAHPKYKKLNELVKDLELVGLIALEDPIRDEVIEAIKVTKKAGIKTVIVTGDHKITAMVVAEKIGLKVNAQQVLEGSDLENINDEQLKNRISDITIFARVSPKHKLRIVDALQARGEIVAMVGDGVNDAPALKTSDIGVAVNSGTDVAKEIADLVLLDNGFHTIIKAIEQGRVIFSNIRKVFIYLLADSFQELYVFLAAMFLGLPLPLLPVQILWINLVEDGLPDLSLTAEQETEHVMNQKPRAKNESVLSKPLKRWLISIFLISGTSALILFYGGLTLTGDLDYVRTMVFALMGLDSLIFVFSVRSFRRTVFRRDVFSNKYMVGAVAISLTLLIMSIYTPVFQNLLSTQPLALNDWLIVVSFSFMEIVLIEFSKVHLLFRHNI